MKKQFTFTLNEELVKWFRKYSEDEDRSMSSIINSYILNLKRDNDDEPTGNILRVD
tara:strand:- start:54 stop:221 length:168 start_codon:yes stop_codon:yes gene_type:complete